MTTTNDNQLDTSQFKGTPIIRKLEKKKTTETTTTRGRKRKYNTPEERLEARRLQQKAYRERKRAIANKLTAELTQAKPAKQTTTESHDAVNEEA